MSTKTVAQYVNHLDQEIAEAKNWRKKFEISRLARMQIELVANQSLSANEILTRQLDEANTIIIEKDKKIQKLLDKIDEINN